MEAPEEIISLGAKDQTHQIVKGKRTKRVRPQSPLPLSATATTTTIAKTEELYEFLGDYNNTKYSAATTTTSSAEFEENSNINNYSSSTEEEEDMANCLILLAQGQSRFSPKPGAKEEGNMMMTTMKSNKNNNYNHNSSSSRRFIEASTIGANKAGFYVYACKTCNKTFPSFQALGGHRASHKKPKNLPPISAILDKEKKKDQDFIIGSPTPLSFQFLNSGSNLNNKNKVHECSICGAEFASGQALGGHMRRHRAHMGTTTMAANNATTLLALNNNPIALGLEADQYHNEDHHHHPRKKRNILSLDLDLNLPAPEDDHQSETSSFPFEPKKQQQQQASLVFSSAHALVDCHY